MFKRPAVALFLTVALSPAAAADAVENLVSGQRFSDLPAAIDAAADGDALVVAEGHYSSFLIDGKGLTITAMPGASVVIETQVEVRALSTGQVVVLSGIEVVGSMDLSAGDGQVWLQDCRIGDPAPALAGLPGGALDCRWNSAPDGAPGLTVVDSPRVAIMDCEIFGHHGFSIGDYWGYFCDGGTGGSGISATRSTLALYGTAVRGGYGGCTDEYGTGRGGIGLEAEDSTVFISGGELLGGPGAITWWTGDPTGPGGAAGALSASSDLVTLETPILGGVSTGQPGPGLTGLGTHRTIEGPARSIELTLLARADSDILVTYRGLAGDRVALPATVAAGYRYLPGIRGVWLTEYPPTSSHRPLGTVVGSSELNLRLRLPPTQPSSPHATLFVQGLSARRTLVPYLERSLASARAVVIINPRSTPDCNGNGVRDVLDILLGTSLDMDHDLIPDECVGP